MIVKRPLHRARVERGLRAERDLDPQQRLAHRLDQRQAARRQLHVPADADQQRIVEVVAQLLQRGTHGRLRHKNPLGGPGHVLLVEQRVQRDQQVEVEAVELHGGGIVRTETYTLETTGNLWSLGSPEKRRPSAASLRT